MCSFGTYVKLCLLVSQGKLKGMTKFKELTDDYSVLLFVAVVAQSLSHVPTLQPHGLQHSSILHWLSPGVCSNSYLLSWWCYLAISYFVTPFSFYFQSFPASGSIPVSWLFTSGGQSIGASASVLPMNIQDWFPLGWTGWISLQSKELSRVFSSTTIQSIKSLALSLLYGPPFTSIHDYRKNHSFDYMDLCQQSNVSAF